MIRSPLVSHILIPDEKEVTGSASSFAGANAKKVRGQAGVPWQTDLFLGHFA
jgi:hypothetical protein